MYAQDTAVQYFKYLEWSQVIYFGPLFFFSFLDTNKYLYARKALACLVHSVDASAGDDIYHVKYIEAHL